MKWDKDRWRSCDQAIMQGAECKRGDGNQEIEIQNNCEKFPKHFIARVEVKVFTYCNRFIWFWSLFLLQKSLVSALWTGVPVLRLSITFLGHKMCPITILWKCAPGHQTLDSCVASICVFFKSGWEVENITAMKHRQMALVRSASWTALGTRQWGMWKSACGKIRLMQVYINLILRV